MVDKVVEPFQVLGAPIKMRYSVNIDDTFEHPRQFEDIVRVLEEADEGDQMEINLTTDGGQLYAVLPLLGAIETTNCHVHVHACSDVASAGTFLLMRAHSVSINEFVTIMCHQVSFGSGGPGNSVASHVAHTIKSSEILMRSMYDKFFTSEEIDRMLSGTDFYMDGDEFMARCELRSELMEKEITAKE